MDSFAARAGFVVDGAGALAHAPLVRDAVADWLAGAGPGAGSATDSGARWTGDGACG
jgi:hypothetical protein